jgi:hypothetical protein
MVLHSLRAGSAVGRRELTGATPLPHGFPLLDVAADADLRIEPVDEQCRTCQGES